MAGSYPDVPGYRFPMSVDGTLGVCYRMSGGETFSITAPHMIMLDADRTTTSNKVAISSYTGGGPYYVAFIFPELRDISGYFLFLAAPGASLRLVEISSNTTNGQDGTWTTVQSPYQYSTTSDSSITHRTNIEPVSWTGVRAIRTTTIHDIFSIHFYGSIATTESPNRLRVVDLDGDDIAAQLDFGNIAQRSSVTRQFKVVNNSSTQTANNITVSLSTTSDASPSIIGQYQISTDNVSYANAINIGNLAPGAESSPIWLRANILNNAQLGPWSARIIAKPVSWS